RFEVADIATLPYPAASFTAVVAIDTLYFTDLDATLAQLKRILTASGQLLAYYAQGANPQTPVERFDRSTLAPACTDLGRALHRQGFAFETWDVTGADVRHARRKRAV
ncbi:MAG: class I SAM-dependent methyltransferase, partial [Caldilineaceae bacterium]|nr:class I SAM-dependent methyltransferase [Caldilineaceae bacterium]